jgi:signal transduction histidine kinase
VLGQSWKRVTTIEFTNQDAPPRAVRVAPEPLVGLLLLAALAAALTPQLPSIVAVLLAAVGVAGIVVVALPATGTIVRRHPSLLAVAAFVVVGALWVYAGVHRAASPPFPGLRYPAGYPLQLFGGGPLFGTAGPGWPWRFGDVALLPAALTLLSAGGGFVLISDAVRVQLGISRTRAPWRQITMRNERGSRIAWRAIPGVALIGIATSLALSVTSGLVAGDPILETFVELAIGAGAAALVAAPLAVGVTMQVDLDKADRAREQERQRFAAHLHDSVLQTLALVQRQAHDPAAVVRLARRQEHALRAWMAGEAELASDTLAAALREVAAEIEDEHSTTVELTAIGDHALDARGEALVAAAREALRNAATHAPGAPVLVFSDVTATRAELFIRDRGPGFELDAVPAERRGLRDAVIGRMAAIGGSATIESVPGQGTEITLRLPYNGRSK